MRRTSWTLALAVVVVLAVAGGAVALSGGRGATSAAQESAPNTAPVELGKLSAMVSLAGTLTHRARSDGSAYDVINQARGTYTLLPEVGDLVGCGGALYRVDDKPVLLLCGTVPAYRDLRPGDAGPDVHQLNRNLHRLGYDADARGDVFTSTTSQALEELQHDKGSAVTGVLDRADAVFLPEPARIARVTGLLGGPARPGGPVVQATSDALEVQVALDPSEQDQVKEGDRARITLPGNVSATGRVERFGRVVRATAGQNGNGGEATIPTYLSLDQPARARRFDAAPVQVDITTKGVDDALSVPVTAVVGRSGGGYAIEVVRPGGHRELVAVRLGLFDTSAGRVQVEGDVHAGDDVVVPTL